MISNSGKLLARLSVRTPIARKRASSQLDSPIGTANALTSHQPIGTSNQPTPSRWTIEEQNHRGQERHYWRWSLRLSVFVAIGAAVSAFGALGAVGAGMWSAYEGREAASQARRQADYAHQQLVQSQSSSRPYVIAQISKDQLTETPLGGNGTDVTISEINARVRFTNFGTTPAIIKRIELAINLNSPDNKALKAHKYGTENILSPSQSTEEFVWSRPISLAENMNLVVGSGTVYVTGRVTYIDTLGQSTIEAFCYTWPRHSRYQETQIEPGYGAICFSRSDPMKEF